MLNKLLIVIVLLSSFWQPMPVIAAEQGNDNSASAETATQMPCHQATSRSKTESAVSDGCSGGHCLHCMAHCGHVSLLHAVSQHFYFPPVHEPGGLIVAFSLELYTESLYRPPIV